MGVSLQIKKAAAPSPHAKGGEETSVRSSAEEETPWEGEEREERVNGHPFIG